MISKDAALALLRHALQIIGGAVIAKGYMDESMTTEVIGAVVSLFSAGWYLLTKKK